MRKKNALLASVPTRFALLRNRRGWLAGRRAVTVVLGAALSIGGVSQAFESVHFVVRKDLDSVRLVKQEDGRKSSVVARFSDSFAANSFYKISRALPDRLVTHELRLFDDRWIQEEAYQAPASLREELSLINHRIREEFFQSAIPFGDLIHAKSQKYDVDPALVAAVMETESRFRKNARSQVGAQGLMQLMPKTGRWMGARNLYDPDQNVDAGAKYLSYLSRRFDGNLKKTIAAYNAGEGVVRRYDGVPPYRETRSYVNKVMSSYHKRNKELKAYTANAATTTEPEIPQPVATEAAVIH
jgi:Transglycosylase SLT domain